MTALVRQSLGDHEWEIIVVDNGTPYIDKTKRHWQKKCTDHGISFTLIHNDAVANPYVSRNLGIQHSQGQIIALLDASCSPHPQWLISGIRALDQSDIVAGRFDLFYKNEKLSSRVHGLLYLNNEKNVHMSYGVPAGNVMMHRSTYTSVGPYDTKAISGQDIAWSHRAMDLGYRISYSDDMSVDYPSHDYSTLLTKMRKYAHGVRALEKSGKITSPKAVDRLRQLLPMRISNYRSALQYRDLDDLPIHKKLYLYLLVWRAKIHYGLTWWI